jgi:hypothetical protein
MVSVLAGRSRGPARHHGAARVLVEDLVLDRVVVAGAEHPDEDRAHDVAGWVADLGDLEGAVDVASRGEGGDPQRRIGVEEECAGAGVGGGEVTPSSAGSPRLAASTSRPGRASSLDTLSDSPHRRWGDRAAAADG